MIIVAWICRECHFASISFSSTSYILSCTLFILYALPRSSLPSPRSLAFPTGQLLRVSCDTSCSLAIKDRRQEADRDGPTGNGNVSSLCVCWIKRGASPSQGARACVRTRCSDYIIYSSAWVRCVAVALHSIYPPVSVAVLKTTWG